MTELAGNEKLLAARAEIEAILKRHDIAGHCVLHMPGFVEIFMDIEPSYSRMAVQRSEHGIAVRVRSKLADYGGDKDAQRRDLEATAGMVSMMAEVLAQETIAMLQMTQTIDEITGAKHTGMRKVVRPKGRPQ